MREDEAFGHRSSDDSFLSSGLKALWECVCVRAPLAHSRSTTVTSYYKYSNTFLVLSLPRSHTNCAFSSVKEAVLLLDRVQKRWILAKAALSGWISPAYWLQNASTPAPVQLSACLQQKQQNPPLWINPSIMFMHTFLQLTQCFKSSSRFSQQVQ